MPQQSLTDFVDDMEKAGLLVRIKDEMRVDQLPRIMEDNPENAVFVERLRDCQLSFLANAYSNHHQYAWALGCERNEIGRKMAETATKRVKPDLVTTAPCKEVILKGDAVD
jgi:2,5-furandicarboxylate decarboxylase 1